MQAIKTKFIGPTNTRGARIKASCEAGEVTIPYPYGLDVIAAHRSAARALLDKIASDCERIHQLAGDHWRWADEEMATGSILGPCYVHVWAPRVERGEA